MFHEKRRRRRRQKAFIRNSESNAVSKIAFQTYSIEMDVVYYTMLIEGRINIFRDHWLIENREIISHAGRIFTREVSGEVKWMIDAVCATMVGKGDLLQDLAEKACVRMRAPGSMPTKKWFPQRYNSLNYCSSVQDQVRWGSMSNLLGWAAWSSWRCP